MSNFGYIENEALRLNYYIEYTDPPSTKRVLIIQGKTDGINFGTDIIEFKRITGEEFSVSPPKSKHQSWFIGEDNRIAVIDAHPDETVSAIEEWKDQSPIPESLLSILKFNITGSEPVE